MTRTNPVRVLNVLGTTNLGGAESRVMELYRALDRNRVQFDFLVHTDQEGQYSGEIRRLGGRIYHVPRFRVYNILAYRRALCRFWGAQRVCGGAWAYDQHGIHLSADREAGGRPGDDRPRQECGRQPGDQRARDKSDTLSAKIQGGLLFYMLCGGG